MSVRIVLATGNAGKVREMQAILGPLGFTVLAQRDFGVPEAEETGSTFIENAILKARNAARHTGLPALADDSGLAVNALGGAPGVRSARYAGPDADDAANNARLLAELAARGVRDATARFHCVLAFLRHADDPLPLIAEGTWEGCIVSEARGNNGFGYDPLFFVATEGCTAAELPPARKNRLSHRGQALSALAAVLSRKTAND